MSELPPGKVLNSSGFDVSIYEFLTTNGRKGYFMKTTSPPRLRSSMIKIFTILLRGQLIKELDLIATYKEKST